MTDSVTKCRVKTVSVFRYDPSIQDEGHYDTFEIQIEDEHLTTILDVLLKIQKEQDPSLSFRYACRVSMCGSCAMVINGRERLAQYHKRHRRFRPSNKS